MIQTLCKKRLIRNWVRSNYLKQRWNFFFYEHVQTTELRRYIGEKKKRDFFWQQSHHPLQRYREKEKNKRDGRSTKYITVTKKKTRNRCSLQTIQKLQIQRLRTNIRRRENEKRKKGKNRYTSHSQGYITFEGKTTPSERISIIGRRFATWFSGGRHPTTSVQRTSK